MKETRAVALVDNERHILTSLTMALEAEGFRVRAFGDTASAFEALAAEPAAVTILDFGNKPFDGLELFRRLRQLSAMPMIFLSAHAERLEELLHRAGRVRVLATSGAERAPLLQEVPTFEEAGVPVQGIGWYAVYAPAKTPAATVSSLNKVITDALAEPGFRERVLKLGLVPKGSTPAELAAIQKADATRWAPAVKASGFTPQQ